MSHPLRVPEGAGFFAPTEPVAGGSELVAHVKQIRNMVRSLQGLPPLPEETE